MDTDSFLVYKKAKGIYVDIAKDVEALFDTSNNDIEGLLHKGGGMD